MDSLCTQSRQCDSLAAHDKTQKNTHTHSSNRESFATEIENEMRLWVKRIRRKRIAMQNLTWDK